MSGTQKLGSVEGDPPDMVTVHVHVDGGDGAGSSVRMLRVSQLPGAKGDGGGEGGGGEGGGGVGGGGDGGGGDGGQCTSG